MGFETRRKAIGAGRNAFNVMVCGAVCGAVLGLGLAIMAGPQPVGAEPQPAGGYGAGVSAASALVEHPASSNSEVTAPEPSSGAAGGVRTVSATASRAPEASPPRRRVAVLETPSEIPVSPSAAAKPEPDAEIIKSVSVSRGDILMKVLTKAGVDRREAHDAITALNRVFNPRKLKVGQEVTLTLRHIGDGTAELELVGVAIDTSVERQVLARRGSDGVFTSRVVTRTFERALQRGAGEIKDSLYLAATRNDLPLGVLMEVIRVFSWDVDFQRDIQRGDRFDVVFERHFDEDGQSVREGDVLAASLTLSGVELKYYRYTPSDDGISDFFDIKGRSVRKALLRTPVDGARLTSRYGRRRHPILGYTRVHRGVDFGARRGTPIYAAGDGVVEAAGWNGAYGRYVRLRHNNQLKTAYAHLRGFARAARRGKRVRQGQVIGYVGSSGRSTGPHLHYEVIRKGRQVNPMGVKLPTGRRLKGRELGRFKTVVENLNTRLAAARGLTRVADTGACGGGEGAGKAGC